jgi:pantothenate synthetase
LAPLGHITGRVVLLGAIRLGQVRLIDNLLIKAKKTSRRPRSH